MTSLLKLDKVSKVYGEGNTEVTALHSISLDVKAGEFIGIVGPSGSGKVRYYQSRVHYYHRQKDIYIREQNITKLSEKEMTDIRLKIGFIFQFANLVPYLNVKEQLLYIAKLKKKVNKNQKSVRIIYQQHLDQEKEKSLSKSTIWWGKQRVAIARAFMNNPDLILADEPTASLDSKRAREVVEMMKREVKESQKQQL